MMQQERNQAGQILADAKLTQQYRLASPAGGNMIAPLCDRSGVLHVFSRGSDGRLYDIQQDPESDTGWSAVDMNFDGGSVACIAAGIESDGTTIVFAANPMNNLYYARDRRWGSQWHCFSKQHSDYATLGLRLGCDKNGELLLAVHQEWGGPPQYIYAVDYRKDNAPWTVLANVYDSGGHFFVDVVDDYGVGADPTSPNGASTILVGTCRKVWSDDYVEAGKTTPWPDGTDEYWAWNEPKGFTRLALAPSPSDPKQSAIFVIKATDDGLYYYDPAAKKLVPVGAGVKLTEIKAELDAQGRLSVMALGADQYLYHVRQDPVSPSGWTDIAVLNRQIKFTTIATTKDRDGIINTFALDPAHNLYRVWQDPATQDWNFERIETGKGPLEQIDAYATQITVLDAVGAPRADAAVEIWASGPVTATVNNETVALDPTTAFACRTNAAGRISVVVPADGLHTPTLTVKADFMEAGEGVVIEPNGDIQRTLRTLTADGLLHPTNADRQPITLLSGPYNSPAVAQALADAVNQVMDMAGAGRDVPRGPYVSPRTPTARVRTAAARDPAATARIDLAATPDAHWQLDFSSGLPVFKRLSTTQAAALMAQRRAALPRAADGFGFDVDWGDVWNSFTDSVAEIVDVVVTAVVDTVNNVVKEIQAQITLLIDKVAHVFDATIDFVEQAFDMVEGFFEKVAVDFRKLFEWLAYIFDWEDINRTAEVVAHVFTTTLTFLSQSAAKAKAVVDGKFDEVSDFVRTEMDAFIASFSSMQTVGEFVNPPLPPMPVFDSRVSHNVLMDAMINNQDQARLVTRAGLLAGTSAGAIPLALIDAIEKLYQDFQTGDGAQAFQEALRYFESIADSPDQLLTLALQGLLKLVESIALFALQGVKAVVDLLFDAIIAVIDALNAMLNESWSIPLVSDIYKMATGKGLTFKPIELFALMLAIPATSIYKVIKGAAPYPTDNAVTAFKNAFTPAWLDQRAWGARPTLPAAGTGPDLADLRIVFSIHFAVNYVGRALVETAINASEAESPRCLAILNVVQRFASSVYSVPYISDDAGPSHDAEVFNWWMQLLGGPTRGAVCLYAKAPKFGDGTLALWGAMHLVAVALLANVPKSEGKYDQVELAENILSCLAPQLLKVVRVLPLPPAAQTIVYKAHAAVTFLSEPAIAILHLDRELSLPPERARLGLPVRPLPAAATASAA